MLEGTIRIGVLILAGLAIALAFLWYVSILYQEIRGTGQVVIDELAVIEPDGKVNGDVGRPLAQMLQARVQTLTRELSDAQEALTKSASSATLTGGRYLGPLRGVEFFDPRKGLQTALLQPVDLKLSVAGVDVGGLIPWLQRGFANRRTLHFTIYRTGNDAQVFGSLDALGISEEGLHLIIKGTDEAPSLASIVDQLAHEILRRYLAQDAKNRLGLLDAPEFVNLADVIVGAAQANRRLIGGRPSDKDFAELVTPVTDLADKVPTWPELCYLAGWISDSANDSTHALKYYGRAVSVFVTEKNTAVASAINARIAALTKQAVPESKETVTSELPASIDYSERIDFIRNSGQEGSVVGQSLAVALEYQIAKTTHEKTKISARYIYYAARKTGGIDVKTDGGAKIEDGIKVLEHEGAVKDEVWPYQAGKYAEQPPAALKDAQRFRITDAKPLNGLREIKLALFNNGPVVGGITVYQGMMNDQTTKTGIVPLPAKNELVIGGHAVVIVGYDDAKKQVKFANSWGKDWGDHGFGYLPYEYVDKYTSDLWTFTFAAN